MPTLAIGKSTAILITYHATIMLLLTPLLTRISRSFSLQRISHLLFALLTLMSLASTWSNMYRYFARSYTESGAGSVEEWLQGTGLFMEAWGVVSGGREGYWWTAQVCGVCAGVLTPLFFVEGRRRGIGGLGRFMALAQLVAISFATSLFFLTLVTTTPLARPLPRPSLRILTPCVLLSLATVPFLDPTKSTFLPLLLAMHALLFPPFFTPKKDMKVRATIEEETPALHFLYVVIAYVNCASYIWYTYQYAWNHPAGILGGMKALLGHMFTHPARASIGWDLVCVSAALLVWFVVTAEGGRRVHALWTGVLGMVLVGPAGQSALELATREAPEDDTP
ncbi:hypothetical protein SAICODRAFT_6302 [Saitoella complicata NRRL Y-17804]|uniref:Uncharacterized protein n=1 Tax=Saitoella complicata (strain BCRC 22490 / CBS 7301 / JCM 7358 / NBRC 10748 / NRRL Y-17804) TaxID=698492 RepID=A0A0E9NK53_SAICN|nr:uncharacterized protein SAICODRAFT_6302 [Saitoella complicata NRRL Y-17804]ODQ54566.1 hypothetical protein SAICODRAFT_6302 [Saitoella complicata NRRL Y-17804]GAO50066.1 hypothetical protein G7K_4201-t1 [Saitoella complicata NRRL Y-17804]